MSTQFLQSQSQLAAEATSKEAAPAAKRTPVRTVSADKHKAFPIALAREGEVVRIMACRAGKGMERKLRDMGLPVGAQVRVVQHKGSGVVLAANATRIALGASAAQLVYVELIGDDGCHVQSCALRAAQTLSGER